MRSNHRRVALALTFSLSTPIFAQTDWTQVTPNTTPPARYGAAMAYDPDRQRTLMIGGVDAASNALNDAWEWDGTNWTPVTPFGMAFGLEPALAHDPVGGGILVLANGLQQGTLRWDGTSWTQVASQAQSPPYRFGIAMASTRDGVLTFGGGMVNAPTNETWQWVGSQWVQRFAPINPSERTYCHMTYDSKRGRVIMSGGVGGSIRYRDTWEWISGRWNLLFVGPSPAAWSMVFDPHRDRVVKVGFDDPVFPFGAYELPVDFQTVGPWEQRTPATTSVPSRAEFALAFDEARNETVLFGGFRGNALDDTWIYRPVTSASYTTFGSGCPGPNGVPAIEAAPGRSNLPWIGERFEVDASTGGTRAAVMLTGFSDTTFAGAPLPLDLTPAGYPGCALYIAAIIATPLNMVWVADIPADPTLVGLEFFQQALVASPGPTVVGLSNAARGVIGAQ